MIEKIIERKQVLSLRKRGMTYSEILKEVQVSKSTISLWLRDAKLSNPQQQKLTERKRAAQLRGGLRKKEIRIDKSSKIFERCLSEIGSLSNREFLLIGAALYWAEGSKQKPHRPSSKLQFGNSDPEMIRLYVDWLRTVLKIHDGDITLTLYLHDNYRERTQEFEHHWLKVTSLRHVNLRNPVYKMHNPKRKYSPSDDAYKGHVSISVKNSTDINRRVQGWIYGIIEARKQNCRFV